MYPKEGDKVLADINRFNDRCREKYHVAIKKAAI
jgi:hypothetical protein